MRDGDSLLIFGKNKCFVMCGHVKDRRGRMEGPMKNREEVSCRFIDKNAYGKVSKAIGVFPDFI